MPACERAGQPVNACVFLYLFASLCAGVCKCETLCVTAPGSGRWGRGVELTAESRATCMSLSARASVDGGGIGGGGGSGGHGWGSAHARK